MYGTTNVSKYFTFENENALRAWHEKRVKGSPGCAAWEVSKSTEVREPLHAQHEKQVMGAPTCAAWEANEVSPCVRANNGRVAA